MKRLIAILLAVFILGTVLTGCGGRNNDAGNVSSTDNGVVNGSNETNTQTGTDASDSKNNGNMAEDFIDEAEDTIDRAGDAADRAINGRNTTNSGTGMIGGR